MNREKVNPLPDRPSEELVAHFSDFFSDFFYDRVKKIADKLKQFPNYIPPVRSTPINSNFRLVTTEVTRKILLKLGCKQCELDTFPVDLVADNIEIFSERSNKAIIHTLTVPR